MAVSRRCARLTGDTQWPSIAECLGAMTTSYLVLTAFGGAPEDLVRDVGELSALGAHQVGMTVLMQMVEGGTVSAVDVFDDLELARR